MLVTRPVTALALNIRKILQPLGHCAPVGARERGGESPAVGGGGEVEAAIVGVRVSVVARRPINQVAGAEIIRALAADRFLKSVRMGRINPVGVTIRSNDATTVTEHARGIHSQIAARRYPLRQVGVPARGCPDAGAYRVRPDDVLAEHRPSGNLEHRGTALVDAVGNLVGRHVGSQRTGFQRRSGSGRTGSQGPSDVGDIRVGNGVVHQDFEVNRLSDRCGGQATRALHTSQPIVINFLGSEGSQGDLPLQGRSGGPSCGRGKHGYDGNGHMERQYAPDLSFRIHIWGW